MTYKVDEQLIDRLFQYGGNIREQILEMDELIVNGEVPSAESYELGKIRTKLNDTYNMVTQLAVLMKEDPFVSTPYITEVEFED